MVTLRQGVAGWLEIHDADAAMTSAEAFGRHFLRCFFCHIGDRYTEDHFCETGRDLIVAMLDELVEA